MASIQQFPNLPAKAVDEEGRLTDSYRYFLRALWERTGGATGATSILLDNIGNTPGDTLFRDATEWRPRAIGPTGSLLSSVVGFPQWLALSVVLDQLGNANGSLAIRGPVAWQIISPGNPNQVLKSNGPGSLLSWANALLAFNLLVPNNFSVTSAVVAGTQTTTLTTRSRVVIAAGAVTVANTDYIIAIKKTVGAATTVNLMTTPATATQIVIKDAKGDAAANNITITPAAGNIDGAGTYVINTNFGSAWISYSGSEWLVLGSH